MRKTLFNFAAAASAAVITGAKSLADVVASSGTSNPAAFNKDVTTLHGRNVVNVACWKGLPDTVKASFGISAELTAILNKAAAEATVQSLKAKRVAILYASQTSTAEAYAKTLGTYAASLGVVPIVASVNDSVPLLSSTFPPDFCIFICAASGVGETPTNAKAFFKALRKGVMNVEGLKYAVLGFGNSHNNFSNQVAANRIDEALSSNKAIQILPTTLA